MTGGEPLLHKDLDSLLRFIKKRDLLVKIDTNGSFPSRLDELIREKLVDWVAMDVKAPMEKYAEAAGAEVDVEGIKESITLIKKSNLEYLFRTTMVPGLLDEGDIEKIGQLCEGAKMFQLQQFIPKDTLDEHFQQKTPYSEKKLRAFAAILEPFVHRVRIEGL
ncbi:unnamed protein product [marine sediment metagenome]|uniref:Radical SAM core domain-containing protein n=1 Tax=marine sediment metagenome TaxID=412755 RepID=X1TBH6_9ZZZZ